MPHTALDGPIPEPVPPHLPGCFFASAPVPSFVGIPVPASFLPFPLPRSTPSHLLFPHFSCSFPLPILCLTRSLHTSSASAPQKNLQKPHPPEPDTPSVFPPEVHRPPPASAGYSGHTARTVSALPDSNLPVLQSPHKHRRTPSDLPASSTLPGPFSPHTDSVPYHKKKAKNPYRFFQSFVQSENKILPLRAL